MGREGAPVRREPSWAVVVAVALAGGVLFFLVVTLASMWLEGEGFDGDAVAGALGVATALFGTGVATRRGWIAPRGRTGRDEQ